MTKEEFRKRINRPDRIADIINYGICISAILGGLFFLIRYFSDFEMVFFFAFIFLFLIGVLGLWRIPLDYVVTQIISDKSIEEKRKIIENYIQKLRTIEVNRSNNYYKIRYRNKFYYPKIDINVFFDETHFLINAKCIDENQGKGIFDFGVTHRATKKIIKEIKGAI